MERWCPRCEWVGEAAEGPCGRCGTPSIPLEELIPAPRPRVERPGAATAAPEAPPGVVSSLATDAPRERGWVPTVAVVAAILALLAGSTVLRHWHGAAPAAGNPGAPPVSVATPSAPTFPERLAYLADQRGFGGRTGAQLFVAGGAGSNATAIPAGREAVAFAWGAAEHLATIDVAGRVHLLPERVSFGSGVRAMAFSHDGSALAVCAGGTEPHITVYTLGSPPRPLGPSVPGCDPTWSANDVYVAYHVRSTGQLIPRIATLNTHLGVHFVTSARGPIEWASPWRYAITPLTTVTPDCRSVQVMDPRGGQRHTVVAFGSLLPQSALRAAGSGRCPVSMLSWSPDGRWLAVGAGPAGSTAGEVYVFDVLTRGVVRSPLDGSGLTPVALSWSAGDDLLVECFTPRGVPVTLEVSLAAGEAVRQITAGDASWSPDGAWILARVGDGWSAFEATNPFRTIPLADFRSRWVAARWCCPPVPVVQAEAERAPPAQTHPTR